MYLRHKAIIRVATPEIITHATRHLIKFAMLKYATILQIVKGRDSFLRRFFTGSSNDIFTFYCVFFGSTRARGSAQNIRSS